MENNTILAVPSPVMGAVFTLSAGAQLDRTALPIGEPKSIPTFDARDAKAPPRFAVTAPKGAPNVVIALIDDIGFGASNAFWGPIKMAAGGLRDKRSHTTALCGPTRAALTQDL